MSLKIFGMVIGLMAASPVIAGEGHSCGDKSKKKAAAQSTEKEVKTVKSEEASLPLAKNESTATTTAKE